MRRYVAGQSIREISREEDRARETVTKIVRSEEMNKYVSTLRQRFYGLGEDAMNAVEAALCQGMDARLGYRLLMDIGVVPSPLERQPIPANEEVIDKASLNIWERTLVGSRDGLTARVLVGLGSMMESRAEQFGYELPTPDEMRHNRTVSDLIDEVTGGRGHELSSSNPAEWNRLRKLVEERLGNLKGIGEKASLPGSEIGRLAEGTVGDNVPEAAQGQASEPPTEVADNTAEDNAVTRSKSRLRLT